MKRTIIAALADIHGGHIYGLLNPLVTLYDRDETGQLVPYQPGQTAIARYEWNLYLEHLGEARDYVGDDDLVVLVVGDIANGAKYPSELVSTRLANHIEIAAADLEPWFAFPTLKAMRLAHGTGAHEFGEGSATSLIASLLRERHREIDVQEVKHARSDIAGALIDYTHHGPHPGKRDWTRGNVARFYLRDFMNLEIRMGNIPPQLLLRAHYHQYVRETLEVENYTSTLIVLPSYDGMSEYAEQRLQGEFMLVNGMILFEVIDGRIKDIKKLIQVQDTRTKEEILCN